MEVNSCDFLDCGTALNTIDNPMTIGMGRDVALMAEFAATAPEPEGLKVVFEANGNKKEVEVESFPRTFACNYQKENGKLDGIIKELYALPFGGGCTFSTPKVTGNAAVTAGRDGKNNLYITISNAFEGTATVTGLYTKYLDAGHTEAEDINYTLTISVKGAIPTAVENVQTNQVQATKFFRDGQLLILRDGKTYNVVGTVVR